MSERHFTPEEVERLIPELRRIMGPLMTAHAEAAALQDALRAEQRRIALAGGGVIDRARWRADQDRLVALGQELARGLAEIAGLGGVPKDLGLGLVDFPHVREGRVVNLCWRYGETTIRFWHGLDEGYAARKPL